MAVTISAKKLSLYFRRVRHIATADAVEKPNEANDQPNVLVKPLILVIDNDMKLCDFISLQLSSQYRVITTNSTREGLAAIDRETPVLILSAIMIPASITGNRGGKTGEETQSTVPVILMTNKADTDTIIEGGYQADDYLIKPFSAAELIARIDVWVRLRDLERRLADTTALMNLIMDNVPAGLVLLKSIPGINHDFTITAVNKNVNRIAGFTEQLLYNGGRLAECLRPAAAQGMYGECDIDKRIAERMAWYASRPNETISSIFPSIGDRFVKAVRSPHGSSGFVVVTIDSTERVKIERALAEKSAQIELMLNNMPGGIFMCARNLTVIACNHHHDSVLGIPGECIQVGRPIETSIRMAAEAGLYTTDHGEIEAQVRWRMEWYASQPTETISIVYPAKGNRFLKFTRSPLGEYGMVVMYLDITDQINIESDLIAARDRAERTLQDLLSAQNKLVHADKMASLGRLVAGIAHEINTPLGIAVTMASMLSERIEGMAAHLQAGRLRRSDMERLITEQREGGELLMANLRRAADLVHSFKQVAADQTSEKRRRFELGDWLSDIVVSLSPLWRRVGHRVEILCPDPIELDGYPGVISQILTNLVTNSVIHGFDPGQAGLLRITATRQHADMIELSYTDDGRGIAPEAQTQVFDPFFTTRRQSGSTGLGMHIIYNLVVGTLGGTVDLRSQEQHGVHFTIRFPG